ncbi:ABC transporter ATP-binding protein [Paenibacillus glycinis]|uniref:ATP-binding cassette domain-containing protein n=1 Tax=Paenibacillus glycinis TaxID=2697035 RepID=A0ABW9XJC5_9BACL|nr:ABC transporter ATP-binding protein [Paenibacillus glycinis]NBD22720.1 ATP-binding cassette domain-containing protein [Paenibacillus glycinis]
MSYVEFERVSKYFGNAGGAPVLDALSLGVEKGEFVTLLGPSGCGKSTLLRCVAGLTEIDEGRVRLDGVDLTNMAPKKRNVGMVFQSYALFPNMTVYDNVAFGLKMKGMARAEIERTVKRMLEIIDMSEKSGQYPHRLSGGQQQRVALARSLAVQPKLMMMDEPLSALDAKIRKMLRVEIRRIQQELGMTTLFVTHDQEEALTMSDRICIMNQGRIEQTGTPEEIYARPKTAFVARFIGNYNVLSAEEMAVIGRTQSASAAGFEPEAYAIRPEAVRISAADDGSGDSPADAYSMDGTVSDCTSLGALLRYTVQVGNLSITTDELNAPASSRHAAGARVRLEVDRNACVPLQG